MKTIYPEEKSGAGSGPTQSRPYPARAVNGGVSGPARPISNPGPALIRSRQVGGRVPTKPQAYISRYERASREGTTCPGFEIIFSLGSLETPPPACQGAPVRFRRRVPFYAESGVDGHATRPPLAGRMGSSRTKKRGDRGNNGPVSRSHSALCANRRVAGETSPSSYHGGSIHDVETPSRKSGATGRRDGHQFATQTILTSEPAARERELIPEGRDRQGTAPKPAGDQPGRAAGTI